MEHSNNWIIKACYWTFYGMVYWVYLLLKILKDCKRIKNINHYKIKTMKTKRSLLTSILTLSIVFAYGQNETKSDTSLTPDKKQVVEYKHSVGGSLLMLSNYCTQNIQSSFSSIP